MRIRADNLQLLLFTFRSCADSVLDAVFPKIIFSKISGRKANQ